MARSRALVAALTCLTITMIAVPVASEASVGKVRKCKAVTVELGHGSEGGGYEVRARGVSCRKARRVVAKCVRGKVPRGWRVNEPGSNERFVLWSGKRRVSYRPAGGGGCTS